MVAPDDLAAPRILDRHARAWLVPLVEPGEPDGAQRIEEPGAFLERIVAVVGLRRVLQNRLDKIWRQLRICLEHERDRSRHLRRGHARAAQT